jgi:CDP-diacylglycerol---serine O-phosphatidyltransferase
MRRVWANMITSISLIAGFAALLLVRTNSALATALLLVAAILDVLDGSLARSAGGDQTFGARLDSLADLLCFCVVPAFTIYSSAPPGLSASASIVGAVVVVSGAWRLARFPLVTEPDYFVGLPTPLSGVVIMAVMLWAPGLVALVCALVLCGLGVTTLRFPSVFTAVGSIRHAARRCSTTLPPEPAGNATTHGRPESHATGTSPPARSTRT